MIIEVDEPNIERGDIPPTEGGCWICHRDKGEMKFSIEWDAWVHQECLEEFGCDSIKDFESRE